MIKTLRRFGPLLILSLILFLFFYLHLDNYLSFESLKSNRTVLMAWTTTHLALSLGAFFVVYVISVAASIPGAWFLTLVAGFLFGPALGTGIVVISASMGALIIFLAVKYAFRDWFTEKTSRWLKAMEHGFQVNAFSYLLFLRFVPLFPFWLVNIIPALLGVQTQTFFVATLLGIIPGSLVYVLVGHGLGHVFDANQTPNLVLIKDPVVLLPLIALGALALVPIIYRQLKNRRTSYHENYKNK